MNINKSTAWKLLEREKQFPIVGSYPIELTGLIASSSAHPQKQSIVIIIPRDNKNNFNGSNFRLTAAGGRPE
jgi:hypothetical protein